MVGKSHSPTLGRYCLIFYKTALMILKLTKSLRFEGLLYAFKWLQLHLIQIILFALLAYLIVQKDITLTVSFNKGLTAVTSVPQEKKVLPIATKIIEKNNPKPILTAAQRQQQAYIERFAKVATQEMDKYGIPASIKLAQGLLESQAGTSELALAHNNHFGIKCFSKKCHKGHCSNFTDDSHKDFFRIFNTPWESYRAHSILLQNHRYKHLSGDYRDWAYGLAKAGYATDPQYGEKLIQLIDSLTLYQYDR